MRFIVVKKIIRFALFQFGLMVIVATLYAQKHPAPITDSIYIQSYDTMLTTRVYLSQKYLSLHIKDKNNSAGTPVIKYYPN